MLETTAPKTTQAHPAEALSAAKFLDLVREHNRGIRDDDAITTEMDAGDLTDADYNAQLVATAEQIQFRGVEDRAADALDDLLPLNATVFEHTLSDAFVRAFIEAFNARVRGYNLIVPKVLADIAAAPTAHVFEPPIVLAKQMKGTDITATGTAVIPDCQFNAGDPISGRVIQRLVEQHNVMQAGWYGIAEALEGTALAAPTATTPDVGNAGDGTATVVKLGPSAIDELITVTFDTATEFTVSGATTGEIGTGEIGTDEGDQALFESDLITILIEQGAAAFEAADAFTVDVAVFAATAGDYIELVTAKLVRELPQARSDAAA